MGLFLQGGPDIVHCHPQTCGSQGTLTQREGRSPYVVPGPGQGDSPLSLNPLQETSETGPREESHFYKRATQWYVCFLTDAFSHKHRWWARGRPCAAGNICIHHVSRCPRPQTRHGDTSCFLLFACMIEGAAQCRPEGAEEEAGGGFISPSKFLGPLNPTHRPPGKGLQCWLAQGLQEPGGQANGCLGEKGVWRPGLWD